MDEAAQTENEARHTAVLTIPQKPERILVPEEEKQIKYLRFLFANPDVAKTPEGQMAVDIANGLNSIKKWVASRATNPLPEEPDGEAFRQAAELEQETHLAVEALVLLGKQLNVYNTSNSSPLYRIAFEPENGHTDFLGIPISNFDGLKAFLSDAAGVYVHDIKAPFTASWGYLQWLRAKPDVYNRCASEINSIIPKINEKVDNGMLELIANLDFLDRGMDLRTLTKAFEDKVEPPIAKLTGRVGQIDTKIYIDREVSEGLLTHGSEFWYRYLLGDIGKNTVNAFTARRLLEIRAETDVGNEIHHNQTPDGVDYSTIADDRTLADFSGIPELLRDRSVRRVIYGICKSPDSQSIEARIYDNATGYPEKIIAHGFIESKRQGIHGYVFDQEKRQDESYQVHSEGSVIARHAELMKRFGVEIIPSFVRDKEGKVVPKAGLTIIRIPIQRTILPM